MPSVDQYPLSIFGTVGQALRHLEKLNVDPQKFVQRIISDVDFRKAVAELYTVGGYTTSATSQTAFGFEIEAEKVERLFAEIGYPRYGYLSDHGDKAERRRVVSLYSDGLRLEALFRSIDETSVQIFLIAIGFAGKRTQKSVRIEFGISEYRLQTIMEDIRRVLKIRLIAQKELEAQ